MYKYCSIKYMQYSTTSMIVVCMYVKFFFELLRRRRN